MNQLDLNGRVAVITGGAQGIGYATAERMLLSGAAVVLWDIDAKALAAARESLSALGTVDTATVELTDAGSQAFVFLGVQKVGCLLYTSPSPRD